MELVLRISYFLLPFYLLYEVIYYEKIKPEVKENSIPYFVYSYYYGIILGILSIILTINEYFKNIFVIIHFIKNWSQ